MRRFRVTALDGLNVRLGTSTSTPRVGLLRHGIEFESQGEITDTRGNLWHTLVASAGGAELRAVDNVAASAPLFAAHVYGGNALTEEVGAVTVPPMSPSDYKTGVWARTRFELVDEAFAAGCRYAVIMDDFGYAGELARRYPDATVIVRRWLAEPLSIGTVDQALNALEGANDPTLVYSLFCEESKRPLEAQAALDIATARAIRERCGARFIGLTSAMGTPDYTSTAVCDVMRYAYAPAYNDGTLGIDKHLYSPTFMHLWQDAEWIWYERRWEFLFKRCGFDPNVRAIYCTETGVDEGGIGGFPDHGIPAADVLRWAVKNRDVQQLPIAVDGKLYPSPIRGGALFQLGDRYTGSGGWSGYNVEYAMPELKTFWRRGG